MSMAKGANVAAKNYFCRLCTRIIPKGTKCAASGRGGAKIHFPSCATLQGGISYGRRVPRHPGADGLTPDGLGAGWLES